MNHWFGMFLATLLIPAIMLVLGYWFKLKGAPKKINRFCGYRTSRSMKNRETWEFAHRRCGAYWSWIGWPALTCAIVYMPTVAGKSEETVSVAGTVILLLQILAMCSACIPVERALKANFDENGNQIG